MRKPSISVSLEGLPFIGLCALLTLALALLGWTFWAFVAFLLTAFTVNFFRDPERVVPAGPDLAVAPADGVVVKVGPALDPATGEERTAVCIFMNVFNVHVNRTPVDAEVTEVVYHEGLFLNASLDKASEDNERNEVRLKDADGQSWNVIQIAGLIARRIVCWTEPGDALGRGQRLGLIKFGSRVDTFLPPTYLPAVSEGQKTVAGQTVIAKRVPQPEQKAAPKKAPAQKAPAKKAAAKKTAAKE